MDKENAYRWVSGLAMSFLAAKEKKWYGLIPMISLIKIQRSSSLFQELCGKFQKKLIMEKDTE